MESEGAPAETALDPRVELMIERLEETCRRVESDESIAVMRRDSASAAHIPLRVREIVEECLAADKWEKSLANASTLSTENSILMTELEKTKQLLVEYQKSNATLSPTKTLSVSMGEQDLEKKVSSIQVQLKRALEEKKMLMERIDLLETAHGVQLKGYQDGELKQAAVMQTLHSKILEYKGKCHELESQLSVQKATFEHNQEQSKGTVQQLQHRVKELETSIEAAETLHRDELNMALDKAEEERQRMTRLAMSNSKLRDELDRSRETSNRLTDSIRRLTEDLSTTQRELSEREKMLKDTFLNESIKMGQMHTASLSEVMGTTANIHSQFSQLKNSTQREVHTLQKELSMMSEQIQSRLDEQQKTFKGVEEQLSSNLKQKEDECKELQEELGKCKTELESLKTQMQLVITDYEKRLSEANVSSMEMKSFCEEKGALMDEMESKNVILEANQSEMHSNLQRHKQKATTLAKDVETLKAALDAITGIVEEPGKSTIPLSTSTPQHQLQPEYSGPFSVSLPNSKTAPIISPTWLISPPTTFMGEEDAVKLKEWTVQLVKSQFELQKKTIQELKHSQQMTEEASKQQQGRLANLQEEVSAHNQTNTMLKNELEACRSNNAELIKTKMELEEEVEVLKMDKGSSERQLGQLEARLESMQAGRMKLEVSNKLLDENVRTLQSQLQQVSQEMETTELELGSKLGNAQRLEVQLSQSREELIDLKLKLTHAEGLRLDMEHQMANLKLSLASLGLEKDNLSRDLRIARDGESSALSELKEARKTNRELEQEKRQFICSLQEMTKQKEDLTNENVTFRQEVVTKGDKNDKLKTINNRLTQQVEELDKQLAMSKSHNAELQATTEQLKQEVSGLTKALGKSKEALNEVQIQRGKLNNTVAKLAQEKGDLVQEKVALSGQVARLQETLRASEDRLSSITTLKEKLEEKIVQLQQALVEVEQNRSSLEETNEKLQKEKQQLTQQQTEFATHKEKQLSQLQNQKEEQLQGVILAAKQRENELESTITQIRKEAETTLTHLSEKHREEISTMSSQQFEVVSKMQDEIATMTKERENEVTKLEHERELVVNRLTEEKDLLMERLTRLQQLYDKKVEEARHQQEQANQLIKEQKAQLDVFQLSSERLSCELKDAEQQIQTLEKKLDHVKKEAQLQIEALKEQLSGANGLVARLEAAEDESQLKIKQLQSKRDSFKRQAGELQRQLDTMTEGKETMRKEANELKVRLMDTEQQFTKATTTANHLQRLLNKVETELQEARTEIKRLQQSLSVSEHDYAKLNNEHCRLQTELTTTQQSYNGTQLELQHVSSKLARLEKSKGDLSNHVSTLTEKMKMINMSCEQRDQEISTYKQKVDNLERERSDLSVNLTSLQQSTYSKGQAYTAKVSQMQTDLNTMKAEKEALENKISLLEVSLETTQTEGNDLARKLSTSEGKREQLSSQFQQVDALCKEVQSKYARLLGALQGTLGLQVVATEGSVDQTDEGRGSDMTKVIQSAPPVDKESGVGTSLTSEVSSFMPSSPYGSALPVQPPMSSPSKLAVMQLDASSIKEAILTIQKRLLAAEQTTEEALFNGTNMERKIQFLEVEKQQLESSLKETRASLVQLQEVYDTVKKSREQAETTLKIKEEAIKRLQARQDELERQVQIQEQQISSDKVARQISESKLQRFSQTQVQSDAENEQLKKKLGDVEIGKKELQSQVSKLRSELLQIQSMRAAKEAEIDRLKQQLYTSQHLNQESNTKVESLLRRVSLLDSSFTHSQSNEGRLDEELKELEERYGIALAEKKELEMKANELQMALTAGQKEKEVLEMELQRLSHSQRHNESLNRSWSERCMELEKKVSDEAITKSQLTTELQKMKTMAYQKEEDFSHLQVQIANLKEEKMSLTSRLESLQVSLKAIEKSKQVTQELCTTLEKEIDRLKKQQRSYQKENAQLKQRLEEAKNNQKTLDNLLLSNQKQRASLDVTLASATKEKSSLQQQVLDLQASHKEKDRDHLLHMESMRSAHQLELSQELQKVKTNHKLQEQHWANKEYDYKKRIQQLETKIRLLQEQITESRQLREDYIRKVGKHDSEIQELRSAMSQHVQKMQPTMTSPVMTQDSSNTSLITTSLPSSTSTKPLSVLTTFNKDEQLTDNSPLKFSAASPKTSTPYKRQSLPHVTSPLTHTSSSPSSELVKPANKFI